MIKILSHSMWEAIYDLMIANLTIRNVIFLCSIGSFHKSNIEHMEISTVTNKCMTVVLRHWASSILLRRIPHRVYTYTSGRDCGLRDGIGIPIVEICIKRSPYRLRSSLRTVALLRGRQAGRLSSVYHKRQLI